MAHLRLSRSGLQNNQWLSSDKSGIKPNSVRNMSVWVTGGGADRAALHHQSLSSFESLMTAETRFHRRITAEVECFRLARHIFWVEHRFN